jgi:hypothetical protein
MLQRLEVGMTDDLSGAVLWTGQGETVFRPRWLVR